MIPLTNSVLRRSVSTTQHLYQEYLNDQNKRVVIGIGTTGTGKTYLACQYALEKIEKNEISRVLLTKPLITVGNENIGALPGSLQQKVDPWLRSIRDNCKIKNKKLLSQFEFAPLGFMRGNTFDDVIIIADEMQNSTPDQMFMLLTRMGKNTKLIVTGDLLQKDIKNKSGLEDFVSKLRQNNLLAADIGLVEFQVEDVQRSDFVKKVLTLYSSSPVVDVSIRINRPLETDSALIPKKL